MPLPLDSYLGIHPQALKLSAQRSELLAANMANADTPGYKARDVDFKAAMTASNASSNLRMTTSTATSNSKHLALDQLQDASGARTLYRVPLAPSLDGNTVDAQVEQANFAQNSIHYQASLSFINAKFRSLMSAITGQ
jgi:flagellar basal-body rod protein FlgB